MKVIFAYLESFANAVAAGFHYLIWLISGLGNLATVMTESLNILEDVLGFFPNSITSTLIAMLGGLIVLRIFGRS